jgi:hypothetical protein
MDFVLLFIIVLQTAYIVYKDISFGKERERHLLKIMSKDVVEYKEAVETVAEDTEKEPEQEIVPIEEISIEEMLLAKDNT